jgi:ribosomal protein L21E
MTAEPGMSHSHWQGTLGRAAEAGVRAIILEVYDGRHAYFPSERLTAHPSSTQFSAC